MNYITGDTHGRFHRIICKIDELGLTKKDTIIILGDASLNYYGNFKDDERKEALKLTKVNIFCIHGNHEMRPESISSYELVDYRGGKAYVEKKYPNIYFAKDGEIYDFDGVKTLCIGGAYSVDKFYRLMNGWAWFEDEQPSEETKKIVEETLEKNNWTVDAILTHTCPVSLEPTEWFLPMIDQSTVDKSTEQWLETIKNKLNYKYWFAGHFHGVKKTDEIEFMYENFHAFPEE